MTTTQPSRYSRYLNALAHNDLEDAVYQKQMRRLEIVRVKLSWNAALPNADIEAQLLEEGFSVAEP